MKTMSLQMPELQFPTEPNSCPICSTRPQLSLTKKPHSLCTTPCILFAKFTSSKYFYEVRRIPEISLLTHKRDFIKNTLKTTK